MARNSGPACAGIMARHGLEYAVLRLVRVAVGSLRLDELPKGQWRLLTKEEIDLL
jgi:16S rRNA U516 pseudouridylate synthase RsuA-like enzyme